ncbi:hypothetical protein MWU65_15350 [Cellulophaga sp. F20128]|uniref:hypothetical protein n=1 Tax=Cellulophaga sp. F20128 TaxID=2926413 RepID=UPI001FF42EB3|nr:hypothetical protein [Cellulophaga sp. F20128]MCK0158565.1 hypothetical protein [Cellulophaga sp. F20128]
MKTIFNHLGIKIFLISFFFISCKTEKKSDELQKKIPLVNENVITVVTQNMEFQMVDTIPSGWNTFVYKNESNETHFFLLDKYPEEKTIENTLTDVAPVFAEGMDLINNGKSQEGFAVFNKLPPWYFEIVFYGGVGLIAPKHTATTTVKLDPGYYIMECYVKMPNGKFHTLMGMAKPVIVTEEDSGNTPPEATVNITLSGETGISYDKPITTGKQVFSILVKDQKPHENFIWHDVNLVKLEDAVTEETLEAWMDWSHPKGLITPVPKGLTFLGGVNDMPTGSTGYFTVNLKPGKYALVSEVPNTIRKNMLKTFTIAN